MPCGPLMLASGLALIASLLFSPRFPRAWLLSLLSSLSFLFVAALLVLVGASSWEWRTLHGPGGEGMHLRLDGLSAFFLLLLCVVAAAGSLYAREYWSDHRHPRSAPRGRLWWGLLVASMSLVLLCSNGLHFLICWELFTVSAYFLITLDRQHREVRAAGWLYLAMSHAGTLCLFAFFSILASKSGSWDLGPMQEQTALAPLFWIALFGFGVKAGLFPLHVWLPSGHANAPSHVSAILSGVAIKMGIYGLVRFSCWLPTPAGGGWVVILLGVVSAILGVAFALGQHDLKRLLAYHSVENIGIILLGLGMALLAREHGSPEWGLLALAGGLLHVWNHGLFKSLLFLAAGSVLHATGTRLMSRLGGLWRKMPWTAACFALGSAAICGLPPLNGFVSEWLIFLGYFEATGAHDHLALAAIPGIIGLALTGALALACFVKASSVVFLGATRSEAAERAHEQGWFMLGPMLGLAAACTTIGLAPVLFWPALKRTAAEWNPAWQQTSAPASLSALCLAHMLLAACLVIVSLALVRLCRKRGVTRALTWDCGYANPDSRMQYSAGSFADLITGWFSWILLPHRHGESPEGHFPARARRESHTPDTILERGLMPVSQAVLYLSNATRRLQHGRLQFYLAYLLAGLVAISILILNVS